jgi:signal transduction histidine kinase
LGAVAGSVRQLARYAQAGVDEQKLVDIVSRESERLNRLVNEILTYSKERQLRRKRTNLIPLMEETLLLVERQPARQGSISVVRNLPTRAIEAPVDPGQIKQLLWNLCDNALRAMPSGGTLRVGLEEDNGVVRIRVADTGLGLTVQQCEKIFEPFESSFAGGTGLGLAIVYQIVQGHGGRVWVASLLIIEDEPIGESLAVAFGHDDYQVTLSPTGREARQRLEQQLFDIIVCDITLPDANGIELLEHTHQVNPDSVFILMTGNSTWGPIATSSSRTAPWKR